MMMRIEHVIPIVKFKTIMLKSILCHYSDTYILVNGTKTIKRARADAAAQEADKRYKQVIFENCTPFTGFISKIHITG